MAQTNYLIGDNKSLREFKGGGGSIIQTTWSELKSLRDKGGLTIGAFYEITDYDCTINPNHTTCSSAHHGFNVIVYATDGSTLTENALAKRREGDTYFTNANLEAWDLKYCLDNDQTKYNFSGSDDDGGKGVIWWMRDEYGNEAYYDFKNVMEIRYEITASTLSDITPELSYIRHFTSLTSKTGWTINTANPLSFYTFSLCLGPDLNKDTILDLSVQDWSKYKHYDDTSYSKNFGNNKLLDKSFFNENYDRFKINCFLVVNGKITPTWVDGEHFYNFFLCSNKLENRNYSNTFNCIYTYNSASGSDGYCNIYCNYNTFGSDCYSNTFGSVCNYNTFSSGCYFNTFGSSCGFNTFSSDCKYNTFGSYCYSNTFGFSCNHNFFASVCCYNTIGTYCEQIKFDSGCIYDTLGSSHASGLTNYCAYILFHSGVQCLNLYCTASPGSISKGDKRYRTDLNGTGYMYFQNIEVHSSTGSCYIDSNGRTAQSYATYSLSSRGLFYKTNVFVNSSNSMTSNTVGY